MTDTAQLMVNLNHFEEAEVLHKQIVAMNLRYLKTDLRVIGNEANLFYLYFQFQKHDKALKVSNDIVTIFNKGNPEQQAQAMHYLVLVQAWALAPNWYDVAEPITRLGQSVLHNKLAGATMDAMNQTSWKNGLSKMEQHFGRKF
jgi:hypothetical protein